MSPFTRRRFLSSASGTVNSTACIPTECFYLPDGFPSPPIPSIPTEDPDPITIDIKHSNRLLPNFLIAAASVLALSFLLLLLFYFLLRLRRRRRRYVVQRHVVHPDAVGTHPLQTGNLNVSNAFEDSFDGTHHIWFIKTVGLDESLIKSIGSRVYKSGDNLEDCSVCLGEFKDGETVKVLPRCKHWFHIECVDTWLKAHVNCPLCRAPVLGDEVKLNELENGNIEIVSLEQSQERHDGSSSSSSSFRRNVDESESEVQPTRRSVSMDASGLGMFMIRVDPENAGKMIEKEDREIELENVSNAYVVEMKRSMSSRSGRLFFPRYGRRGRSTSVLPL